MHTQAGELSCLCEITDKWQISDGRRGPQPKKLNTESWVKGRQATGTKHVKETPPDLRLDSIYFLML